MSKYLAELPSSSLLLLLSDWSWKSVLPEVDTSKQYDLLSVTGAMGEGAGFMVAFLGPKGSYCHQVCDLFASSMNLVFTKSMFHGGMSSQVLVKEVSS